MLTKWIISRIPNHEDVKNERVRSAYGKAASLVGIGCNVLLFAGKLVAGLLSGSVAIMADAVNNLSDASSSLISLLGFKLADRPADAEHPYGHGRFEYLSGEISAIPPGDGRDQFSVFIAQCHGETVNFGLDQKGDPLP